MDDLYIGLMSGTSLDGVDAVLASFTPTLKVHGHAHRPFGAALRRELLALNTPGADELHRAALAGIDLAQTYASAVHEVLRVAGLNRDQVRAVGAHGQTVRHRPGCGEGVGYTIQINQPALLAELVGIDVVADFRSRDVAAGGQGAPLVPAFHRAVFARAGEALAVVNLGGIANLTLVDAEGRTLGFDTGPANALLDHWCERHTGRPYDAGGHWAARGRVLAPLLALLRQEPYFGAPPPKSTGRDLFHPDWLQARLAQIGGAPAAEDVQATLAELTATTVADAFHAHAAGARELLVCGGGAFNTDLMRRLARQVPGVTLVPSDARGLPASQVEGCAFAWLAAEHLAGRPGSLASVTGARGDRLLGALYPSG
jgi:anhydro-N-acetylmuramic acid kinase